MTASRQRVTHNKYQVLDAPENLNMMMNMNALVWGLSTTFVGSYDVFYLLIFLREMSIWIYRDEDLIYFGLLNYLDHHHSKDENLVLYFLESKN